MHPAAGILISYLLGSIPFAYLAGRARGIDLRQHGSGNLGASNALRVLGPGIGGIVYLGDTLKGLLPVLVLPPYTDVARPLPWAIAFGVAAILGHVRPIFLLGKGGGKGVATAGGMFFGLAWLPSLIALLVFSVVLAVTRISSVASMSAAMTLPAAIFFWKGPTNALFPMSVAVGLFVLWMHRSNIRRLRQGTEPRIGKRRPGAPTA